MKTYIVTKKVTQEWTLEVEAEDEYEALETAYDTKEDEWTPPDPGDFEEDYEVEEDE